jgi:hypothetical protein
MAEILVTALDFNAIKSNLKNYLSSQTQFADYNFEGSGLSIFLDVLAYNTHYNAILAHLLANEFFLDSAVKRSSVVSHAKTLGYTPRSATSAKALVQLTVLPTGVPPSTIVLPTTTEFQAQSNGQAASFYPDKEYIADYNGTAYVFPEVALVEGTRITTQFSIAIDNVSGPLVLPNQNIDTSTIKVIVRNSIDSLVETSFSSSKTIVDVVPTDKVFWVEEGTNGRHQLLFGDNIIGKSLIFGNIVSVSYLVTVGDASANGTRLFTLGSTISGYTNVSIGLIQAASGGAAPEGIDSIRFNAPRFNSTRNRVVTAQDYKTLIRANYPYVKGISVWGGDENVPPIYGKVFISIDPLNGFNLTRTDKEGIIRSILRPRGVLSIQHEFVEPDYLYISLDVQTTYDAVTARLSSSILEASIRNAVVEFFEDEVSTLDKVFYYSRLLQYIDKTDPSIVGSQVALKLHKRLKPINNTSTYINTYYNTKIEPSSVFSSVFLAEVEKKSYTGYLADAPLTKTTGTIQLREYRTDAVLVSNMGTVNYETGNVSVSGITVLGYISGMQDLRIYATPEELGYNIAPIKVSTTDISTGAVYPYPAQNVILSLDTSPAIFSAGTPLGLKVTSKASITQQ